MAATFAVGGLSIGLSKLLPHQPNPTASRFLGRKLRTSSQLKTTPNPKTLIVFESGGAWIHGVVTVMECGDMIYRSTLPKSNALTIIVPNAILALGALSYLWATPDVAPGFFDMFVLAFVERFFRPTYKKVENC